MCGAAASHSVLRPFAYGTDADDLCDGCLPAPDDGTSVRLRDAHILVGDARRAVHVRVLRGFGPPDRPCSCCDGDPGDGRYAEGRMLLPDGALYAGCRDCVAAVADRCGSVLDPSDY